MARSSIKLIRILRETALRLQKGLEYQWGHMGSCNCGHLAQSITKFNKATIHAAALQRHGDWAEQLRDYCPQSGLPLDIIIDKVLEVGLTKEDLSHLERLSDPKILKRLPSGQRILQHNKRQDVILYFNTWADLLEEELIVSISIDNLTARTNHKSKRNLMHTS